MSTHTDVIVQSKTLEQNGAEHDWDPHPQSPTIELVGGEPTQNGKTEEKIGFFAKLKRCFAIILPPGGILASAFNLASSSIGAGVLGLPLATNSSGLIMAIIYLVIITLVSIFSMYLLAVAAEKTQIKSFEGCSRALLGGKFAIGVAAIRAFHSFSGCVAYVISVGDIITSIVSHSSTAPEFLKKTSGIRLLTSLVWLFAMVPFVIPRHIDSLRYFSTFSVVFMIYFIIMIIVHSCMNGFPENVHSVSVGNDDNAKIILFNSGNKALEALGVFMFAYVCQIAAFEVYWDLTERTIMRFTIASTIGMVICFIMYAAVSVFGYMDFGSAVDKSILLMYDPIANPAFMAAFIGVTCKLCGIYALLTMTCRNALYYCVGWNDPDKLVFWKHCLFVLAISICVLFCGLFIPNIKMVFGFAGSITGGSLGFVLPSLFFMYAGGFTWKKVGSTVYLLTYLLLLSGVFAIVCGTGATIYGTVIG